MFKVGDRVKVVRAVSSLVGVAVGEYGAIIGKGTIDSEYGQLYKVRLDKRNWWLFDCELEHDKEHQVLTILREYEKNREVLQRQSRG